MQFVVKKPEKQLTIIFCLPGPRFSGDFLIRWSELLLWCVKNNITPLLSQQYDAVVYYVRNKCLGGNVLLGKNQKPFENGKLKYDYIMWIDSDILFTVEQFQKLLKHNLDIVSGMYMMKGSQFFATVKDWNTTYFKNHGSFQFLTPNDIKNKKDLIEVCYTGLGFMLVKNGVFELLEYPWFRPLFQEIGVSYDFCSEDVAFCKLIAEKGYKIYVDPTIRVLHEKTIPI